MLINNLIFLYHMMVASENLLAVAAEQDPILREYFLHHLEEERDHAQWLAEDLASVGIKVEHTEIPPLAREMVGSVYYLIFHADPAALLGYMRVLEGWPTSQDRFREIQERYPESLLRTAKHHAQHDPQHLAELIKVIEGLPPERRMIVERTAQMTFDYLVRAVQQFAQVRKAS